MLGLLLYDVYILPDKYPTIWAHDKNAFTELQRIFEIIFFGNFLQLDFRTFVACLLYCI